MLLFAGPMILGNLLQQCYNIVDMLIVGRALGAGALAAVGSAYSLMTFLTSVLIGMCMGSGSLFSYSIGKRDTARLQYEMTASFSFIGIVTIVMNIVVFVCMKPILNILQIPEDIYGMMQEYVWYIFWGIFFVFLYNYFSFLLRAAGDSVVSLVFLGISSGLNIVLDLVFIIVFRMGAAGAAYATVIAQGISGILCLLYIAKKVPALYLHREDWEIDKNLAGWQLKIGLPMGLQYSITAIGTMMVQTSLNILGSTLVAAFTAANKIEQVATQVYVALGTTMATYCAQNMGAGKYTRIRKGFKSATLIGFIYAVVTGVIIFFVGKYMTIFFVSENVNQIMEYVDIYLRCVSVSFLPLVIVNLYRNGIQGMGYGLLPMTAGIAELVGRSGASLIASHFGSYMGICLASPAAWVLAGTLLLIMYFEIMKGKKDRNLKNR